MIFTMSAFTKMYLLYSEILAFNQRQLIEQANFAHSPLRKPFEKPIDWCFRASRTSNKKDELKQIEGIFPQNLMNENIIKTDELHFKLKRTKVFNFSEHSLPKNAFT